MVLAALTGLVIGFVSVWRFGEFIQAGIFLLIHFFRIFFMRRLNNDQIALEMGIKRRAVDNYVSLIYEKTGVNDRNALIEKYGQ